MSLFHVKISWLYANRVKEILVSRIRHEETKLRHHPVAIMINNVTETERYEAILRQRHIRLAAAVVTLVTFAVVGVSLGLTFVSIGTYSYWLMKQICRPVL